ncbi:MAG: hypothetical protein JOZ59_02680 [Candidatus Eremiobacteraeota bacterium]|nr:hypothetical protein [Candidatus Eremiobacteraeota bacterium]
MTKKIGVLFGMEDTFPWALMEAITQRSGGDAQGVPVEISGLRDDAPIPYALIFDRISHEVEFYRIFLKTAVARGVPVLNNPFWWSSDDKFFDNIVAADFGVAVPKTVLLPHKDYPPRTEAKSFRNLKPVEWDAVFEYLGFPIFMKPAYGGGWRDVHKCDDKESFFAAYAQTRDLCMIAQEAIEFSSYYRCYVLGRSRVRVMRYDPIVPHEHRYQTDHLEREPEMEERVREDALKLCDALGYDLNTVEFAVRDGTPYAIDFMNPAPDADLASVGRANFDWVVQNMADVLIERVRNPIPFELAGSWTRRMLSPAAAAR